MGEFSIMIRLSALILTNYIHVKQLYVGHFLK